MIEALLPFLKEGGLSAFTVATLGLLFYFAMQNNSKTFMETLHRVSEESTKGHEAKLTEIHTLNDFIRSSMMDVIKENTLSNLAVVKEMERFGGIAERVSRALDRVDRHLDSEKK